MKQNQLVYVLKQLLIIKVLNVENLHVRKDKLLFLKKIIQEKIKIKNNYINLL